MAPYAAAVPPTTVLSAILRRSWLLLSGVLAAPLMVISPTPTGSPEQNDVAMTVVLVLHCAVGLLLVGILVHSRTRKLWPQLAKMLSWSASWAADIVGGWYYLATSAATLFAVYGCHIGIFHWSTAAAFIGGALVLGVSGNVAVRLLNSRPSLRGDLATFLGASHALGLIFIASLVQQNLLDAQDAFAGEVLLGTVLALSLLAFPTSAALWARIAVALPNDQQTNPPPTEARVVGILSHEQRTVVTQPARRSPGALILALLAVVLAVAATARRT